MIWTDLNLIDTLKNGGVVVMPTDTIYGIVGSALSVSVVNRIYTIRKRNLNKPCIILIGDIGELEKFSVSLSKIQKEKLKECWPATAKAVAGQPEPVSIILDCLEEKFSYLRRRTKSLAFRLPALKEFRAFLKETGPLIAPSANSEGLLPAKNIAEAKKYFGDSVDLYVDGGVLIGKASKIIELRKDGSVSILRE